MIQTRTAQRFSTAELPEENRVALWEDHNESELFDLRCSTLGVAPLEACMVNLNLSHISLARVRGNPHIVERTAELVRHRPSDSIAIYLTLIGKASFYHDDGVRSVRPGQLLVCDADRPFMRGFSRGLEELAVKVPRALFTELTGFATLAKPVVMDFANGALEARTLARLVGRAVRTEDAHPLDEEVVLQLMGQVVAGKQGSVAAIHLVTAKAFIEEQLTNPSLTAARVANGVGISERHLSRLFSSSGSSLPNYILMRRLDRARTLLELDPVLSVAEVAVRVGFGSATYFSHAFRERFGERATDVRRRMRTLSTA